MKKDEQKTNEPIVSLLATFKELSVVMGMSVNELMSIAEDTEVIVDTTEMSEADVQLLQVFNQLTDDEQRQVIDFSKYLLTKRQAQKTVRVYRAARSSDHHGPEIIEMDAERLKKLEELPDTDDDLL